MNKQRFDAHNVSLVDIKHWTLPWNSICGVQRTLQFAPLKSNIKRIESNDVTRSYFRANRTNLSSKSLGTIITALPY
jgi:hypothetical protein